jgi:hypothetical protein
MHGRPRLHAAARVGLVVAALVVLLNFVLPDVLSSIALPDLPGFPSWLRWLWRAVVITAIALAVIGEMQRDRDDPRGE